MPHDLDRHRPSRLPIVPLFRERWSARALSGEAIGRDEVLTLLEAARWAPADRGEPPWRIVFALRDAESWPVLLDQVPETERPWARHAGALLALLIPDTAPQGTLPPLFAAGAAWQNLALQATDMGLVTHALAPSAGAPPLPGVPPAYRPVAITVVGRPGRPQDLPEPWREREVPSGRARLERYVGEGRFPTPD